MLAWIFLVAFRQRRTVENKLVIGDDRLEEIEVLLRNANISANEAQSKYDEVGTCNLKMRDKQGLITYATNKLFFPCRKIKNLCIKVHHGTYYHWPIFGCSQPLTKKLLFLKLFFLLC